jgi:hypothetical protein
MVAQVWTKRTQFAVRANIAIQGDPSDPQFLTELTDLGVTIVHSRLGQANLRFAQAKFPASLAPPSTRRLQPGQRPLPNQFSLEFSQCGKDAKH